MLPELAYGQKVFAEITHPEHGGAGWELGQCLWSPQKDKGGAARWKIMNEINPGDIIIHFVTFEPDGYLLYGISFASSHLRYPETSPPVPADWEGPYQRVNIRNFEKINSPIPVKDLFQAYRHDLMNILDKSPDSQFYVYDKKVGLKMQQAYIVRCDRTLYDLLNKYLDKIGFNPIFGTNEFIPTVHEPAHPDYDTPPGRIETIVSRIIRDTTLVRDLKERCNWKC